MQNRKKAKLILLKRQKNLEICVKSFETGAAFPTRVVSWEEVALSRRQPTQPTTRRTQLPLMYKWVHLRFTLYTNKLVGAFQHLSFYLLVEAFVH